MNTRNRRTIALVLSVAMIGSAASCSNKPAEKNRAFVVPGFGELQGKGETRQSVIQRFGTPLAEETIGAAKEYHVLTYPSQDGSEKFLLLFYKDEFLAASRELPRGREFITSTARSHARHQEGRVPLYRSWREGKTAYFITTRDQLGRTPKWSPRHQTPAPLSEAQAETIARAWVQTNAPAVMAQPKVRSVQECRSVPDASFYIVGLNVLQAPPHLREIVVLMDGSVLTGELEEQ